MTDVSIQATENGPLKVRGPIELTDAEGGHIEVQSETVFLCRCGGSMNKPFCDGTHSKVGFQGATAAVREAEES
ncbi:MAG: CDGSH iron-sulfur domain-containing protein [Solirubrobacterales bacterium]|nr:CDGSH iron-sulfur domain-containing protein [Solirubrobacterales bacterium]